MFVTDKCGPIRAIDRQDTPPTQLWLLCPSLQALPTAGLSCTCKPRMWHFGWFRRYWREILI